MPKDYAKMRARHVPKKASRRFAVGKKSIIVLICISILISLWWVLREVSLGNRHFWIQWQSVLQHTPKKEEKGKNHAPAMIVPKVTFEFYESLPEGVSKSRDLLDYSEKVTQHDRADNEINHAQNSIIEKARVVSEDGHDDVLENNHALEKNSSNVAEKSTETIVVSPVNEQELETLLHQEINEIKIKSVHHPNQSHHRMGK
jgi:hypothetical protein